MTWRIAILTVLLSVMFICSCSSRVEYQPSQQVNVAADAININIASTDEFEKLPHIGRKTAEAIVAFREENGGIRRVEHLLLIKGVSEKRFAELRPLLKTE